MLIRIKSSPCILIWQVKLNSTMIIEILLKFRKLLMEEGANVIGCQINAISLTAKFMKLLMKKYKMPNECKMI